MFDAADRQDMMETLGLMHEIDGNQLLCIVNRGELDSGGFERMLSERQELTYIEGETTGRVAGTQVDLDGTDWRIVSVQNNDGFVTWILEREVG